MKNFVRLLVLIVATSSASLANAGGDRSMVSMNVHCFKDNWEFRFQRILDHFLRISPDVISLQEVCADPVTKKSQAEYIRNYLSSRGYPVQSFVEQYTHPAWDKYDESILILSKLPSQQTEKAFLPQSLLQRGYVALNIDGTWYIDTHLEYREDNGRYRSQQIDFLVQRFAGTPHIIMGDFNSTPNDAEQGRFWRERYLNVFPGNSIDGFWLSPQAQGQMRVQSAYPMLDQPVDGQFLSDHFAVWLGLRFGTI